MKTILVLVDFSEASQKAIRFISQFFIDHHLSTRILILNTYLVPHGSQNIISQNDELRNYSLAGLDKVLSFAKEHVRGDHVMLETICRMGTLSNVASSLVQEEGVDLVIFGVNREPEFDRLYGLLQENHCPIMLLP